MLPVEIYWTKCRRAENYRTNCLYTHVTRESFPLSNLSNIQCFVSISEITLCSFSLLHSSRKHGSFFPFSPTSLPYKTFIHSLNFFFNRPSGLIHFLIVTVSSHFLTCLHFCLSEMYLRQFYSKSYHSLIHSVTTL